MVESEEEEDKKEVFKTISVNDDNFTKLQVTMKDSIDEAEDRIWAIDLFIKQLGERKKGLAEDISKLKEVLSQVNKHIIYLDEEKTQLKYMVGLWKDIEMEDER